MGFFLVTGCSNGKSPVTPTDLTDTNNSPLAEISSSGGPSSGLGLLGAYELTINPNDKSVELIPKRTSTIGESFTVNGLIFFTKTPCYNCFRLKSAKWGGELTLGFELEHPLPKGDTGQPPSAANRLDLDIFDVAALVKSTGSNFYPPVFDLNFKKAFNAVTNADFYTGELENLLGVEGDILPAVLVVDNAEMGLNTNNKFEMGTTESFEIKFVYNSDYLSHDIYLTFGYGVSATWQSRFEPKYYNPEFNRKAAWKIEVETLGFWIDTDSTTTVDVEVKVWDWQNSATVSTEPDFADADPSHVYAASKVDSVSIEILGMNNSVTTVDGATNISGSGTPLSPLIYHIPVKNSNLIPNGDYKGLVKVIDQRPPLLPDDNRDILIDSTDGVILDKYELSEYASYQIFTANVESGCSGYCWSESWGYSNSDRVDSITIDDFGNVFIVGRMTYGSSPYASLRSYDTNGNYRMERFWNTLDGVYIRDIALDESGNIYTCGVFSGTGEFSPQGGVQKNSIGSYDAFLSKFDSYGYWLWTETWGSAQPELCNSVDINSSGDIYVFGEFYDTVDFNPDGGGSHSSNGSRDIYLSKFDSAGTWLMTQTWGGLSSELATTISIDQLDNVYATGAFAETVEFNPDGGGLRGSNGDRDPFLSKFDSNDNWQWVRTWGGTQSDDSQSVVAGYNSDIYVCGKFSGTADFDPNGGGTKVAVDFQDIYLTKFLSDGSWEWARTFGGPNIETIADIGINQSGDIFLTGNFQFNCDFNPNGGSPQNSVAGSYDSYITKFDSDGQWILAKVWGGDQEDSGNSIEVDYFGNAYIGGQFTGTSNFDPDGNEPHISYGSYDCFVLKLKY